MNPQYKIMISAPYMMPEINRFKTFFIKKGYEVLVPEVRERLEEDALLTMIGDIDGVICGDDRFSEKVLKQAKKLKVISKWGTGIDSIDQVACKKYGIILKNTPNAFSEPVADTVMAFICAHARKIVELDEKMKQGLWHKETAIALNECLLGVIGVGNVGKAVIKRAHGFGMQILGNDIREIDPAFLERYSISMVSKDDLLKRCDFVSLNCDLNPTSHHLIDQKELALMKPGVFLINTARGPIVRESALIQALQENKIAGCSLDVFELEPLPEESPLRSMKNVFLSPHNSNSSPKAWERVHENTIKNLLTVLEK
jgi:D-3-phosphoglycerate dehydrogenase / 2-oxoglutarate reductase